MSSRLWTIITAMVMALSLLVTNVSRRQQVQFEEGEAGNRNGNFIVAVTGYESAIRMYLPFSSRVEESAENIWHLGEIAERNGNIDQALLAYRSLRSAFYAVRWIVQPGQNWIDCCDRKIAVLAPLRKGSNQ